MEERLQCQQTAAGSGGERYLGVGDVGQVDLTPEKRRPEGFSGPPGHPRKRGNAYLVVRTNP